MNDIAFVKISASEKQTKELYGLLEQRTFAISHASMPTFEAHTAFVRNHPYIEWFMIYCNDIPVGSFYIQDDNSIGINLIDPDEETVGRIKDFVTANFSPQPQVLSKVPPYFFVNVPSGDTKLAQVLMYLGAKEIQVSYRL